MRVSSLLPLALAACAGQSGDTAKAPVVGPPLGMILANDGQLYAGAARVDITPTITETFTDLDNDHYFDGCINDPNADRAEFGCEEPFNDANGNGEFDAIFIAGFGSPRPAQEVHDPITTSAVVLSLNGEYVALVGIDAVGVLESRIRKVRNRLAADGFDMDRIVVSASHTHQGPDTVGIWGDEESLVTGINADYMLTLEDGIYDAVVTAAGQMVPVTPTVGAKNLADVDPQTTGVAFGGTNPDDWMIGTINDIRDPLIANDQVLAMAFDDAAGSRVATVVNFSSHPEVVGDENNALSSDYVGYARDYLEAAQGGITVWQSGSLGGMQSALSGTLPSIQLDGTRDLDGSGETVWLQGSGFELAQAQGILVAEGAMAALTDSTPWDKIQVRTAPLNIAVSNIGYQVAFQVGLLDSTREELLEGPDCPGYEDPGSDVYACVPAGIWALNLGPVAFASVPGELFPELFWGVPDEAAMADAALRPTDRRWKQANDACADVDYADCKDVETVGDCDCLSHHATPYRVSDEGVPPLADLLTGSYKAVIGIANGYCGYIVPPPDFSNYVSILTDNGDHYEETNACSPKFGNQVQDAFVELLGG